MASNNNGNGIDRSQYRNPDMPVGYVGPTPRIVYTQGEVIDGVHYMWARLLYEIDIENQPDYARYQGLDFLSSSEDEDEKKDESKKQKKKKEKDRVTIKKETIDDDDDDDDDDGRTNLRKKDDQEFFDDDDNWRTNLRKRDPKNPSSLEDFLEKMEIECDPEKGAKKKIKKLKKEHRSDSKSPKRESSPPPNYQSFSPGPSTSHRHHSSSRKKSSALVSYSRSPSPEDYKDVKMKPDPLEEPRFPQNLHGFYHCDVCNITMNSFLTFSTHLNGKKHLKATKQKNLNDFVSTDVPLPPDSEPVSKYPKEKPNVIRRKVPTRAMIQSRVEWEVNKPCPGLDKVIEIQGLTQNDYCCSLCDSACNSNSLISHLSGFKHQLNLLKHFKPSVYEKFQYEQKYKIEKPIMEILKEVEAAEGGRGRISVEVEELITSKDNLALKDIKDSKSQRSSSTDTHISQKPSTSREPHTSRASSTRRARSMGTDRDLDISFLERYRHSTEPDAQSSDFFCRICQSHMNSQQMWDSHINGKRHLANVKKLPGDKPSKSKTVLVPNKRAHLLYRIEKEIPNETVVGLQEIREIEVLERNTHSYQCFLCGSCHTDADIVDHVISYKHRLRYLEHIDHPGLTDDIYEMSDAQAAPFVRDMCIEVQFSEGTGYPEVHVNRNALRQ